MAITKNKVRKRKTPPVLTSKQERKYFRRKELSEEIGRQERLLKQLRDERHKHDAFLAPLFEPHGDKRRLANGVVVIRKVIDVQDCIVTKDMVGKPYKSGYSYPKYSEIASLS
jgi:hypothetical protein